MCIRLLSAAHGIINDDDDNDVDGDKHPIPTLLEKQAIGKLRQFRI